jgi:hypothetical protein
MMGNIKNEKNFTLALRTYRNDDDSTSLTIPKDFAEELQIGNSKVLMSILENFDGDKFLVISKIKQEILIQ